VVYELEPHGAGVSIMIADKKSGGVAKLVNKWSPKEQTIPTIVSGIEKTQPSSYPIDGPAAAAAAAQVTVDTLSPRHRRGTSYLTVFVLCRHPDI